MSQAKSILLRAARIDIEPVINSCTSLYLQLAVSCSCLKIFSVGAGFRALPILLIIFIETSQSTLP